MRRHGVAVRPHVKTHKIPELASLQLALGATGITVATVAEARAFAEAGIDDIFVAYELADPTQIAELLPLADRTRISVAVDSLEGARLLSEGAHEHGIDLEVVLEIDLGIGRTGVRAEGATTMAREIAKLRGLVLVGVFGFRGVYPFAQRNEHNLGSWGREEGEILVACAQRLRDAGHDLTRVSAGSTPTALPAATVKGISEVRPGQYLLGCANVFAQGAMRPEQAALFVRATVMSRPEETRAVVDAGTKALSADEPWRPGDGYGYLVDDPASQLMRLWEEHGVIELSPDSRSLRVGDRVSIVPNHVCSTVNMHERLMAMRAGRVEALWTVRARR